MASGRIKISFLQGKLSIYIGRAVYLKSDLSDFVEAYISKDKNRLILVPTMADSKRARKPSALRGKNSYILTFRDNLDDKIFNYYKEFFAKEVRFDYIEGGGLLIYL